jgi:general stress protein 26
MKAKDQSSPELTHLCKLIGHIPIATLTISDKSGAPVRQPLVPLEIDDQGVLWFFGNLHPTNIEQPCDANLSFVDTVKPTYVELSGLAEIHVDQARLERLWTPFSRPCFPDAPGSAMPALLKFVPKKAEYWDASLSKLVRMATTAASAVAGRAQGLKARHTLMGLPKRLPDAAAP